ncbi:MAG: hypothetical protein P4L03_01525 [Terracidiphilus sp.]|nr:hypothetical protein [Terracidiphilus sp.]
MNIEFEYRYRDWGNFKRYSTVIFSNKRHLTLEEVSNRVLCISTDEQFFNASQLGTPELFFRDSPFDPDLDHGQHEFYSVSETELPANDVPQRDILDLLLQMEDSVVSYQPVAM